MMRTTLIAALAVAAAGFNAPASKAALAPRAAVSAPRFAEVSMSEPSDKAVTIGAASAGGILGVYLFGDLGTAVFLACLGAYGSTLTNGFGSATKSAGTFSAKVYGKTLEINEQYDVLPKAKSALDTGRRPRLNQPTRTRGWAGRRGAPPPCAQPTAPARP